MKKAIFNNILILVLIFGLFIILPLHGQEKETDKEKKKVPETKHSFKRNTDPKHSVYGPPGSQEWKLQLAYDHRSNEGVSAFSFFRKDQRGKTIVFSLLDNSFDSTNQYRVQQISGGMSLFPFNDDDRYQVDIGTTYDRIKDSTLNNIALFSRFTWRPNKFLWMRVGFEHYDGHFLEHSENSYGESSLSSYYLAAKLNFGFISPIAVFGRGILDGRENNRFGGGALLKGPYSTFLFGGHIRSDDESENVNTFAIGRWAPFRPDGLPSGIFVWKHKDDYDFQLGGIFFGSRNNFVRPAAIGMITGMFISNMTLRVNSHLRQKRLMTVSESYGDADISIFYVHLNQMITPESKVGFSVFQFYKLFANKKFWIFREPVIGLFYNIETTPTANFNPATHQMEFGEKTEKFWSFHIGTTLFKNLMINIISEPSRSGLIIAASWLFK
ncbi:MAG: hypothetical protein ABFR75_10330 [Acidobacteriota bacterium]